MVDSKLSVVFHDMTTIRTEDLSEKDGEPTFKDIWIYPLRMNYQDVLCC